jgi:signal transduction histidine kinase
MSRALPILPRSWQLKEELRTVVLIVAMCSWLAVLGTLQNPGSIAYALIAANAIGLTQYSITVLARLAFRGRMHPWMLVLMIPTGFVIGSRLASLTGAPDIALWVIRDPWAAGSIISAALWMGIAITALLLYVSHTRRVREELERQRRRAAEALQAETAARLALLQAQIEPHFLFNTLANIHSLIPEDPDTASLILEELNAYLRKSLRRTRQATATLGEELDLVQTLLAIAAARLGRRLGYTIVAPPELRSLSLPPLLLQPLVENAIRHGIEPAVGGGKIEVSARQGSDTLELTVADTGVGLKEEAPQGVGLANVRARLASLYGETAKLAFYANTPHGVVAKLIIPTVSTMSLP